MGGNFSYFEIAIIWLLYSLCFYAFAKLTYLLMKWLVDRVKGRRLNLIDILIYFGIIIVGTLIMVWTPEYVPYGFEILMINITFWTFFIHWKPYQWHKKNPTSQLIFKEHGINKFTWNNVRRYIFDPKYFLVNEHSIAKFNYMDSTILYWPSVREIYWREFEADNKITENIQIKVSDDISLSIRSEQNNFDKAVDIMKKKYPEFQKNWDKRGELSVYKDVGTLLYQKYQK